MSESQPLKSVFSVSQPRSGHHVVEMMLRAAWPERFRYCEFYTEPDCCHRIPCSRRLEFAAQGYALFLQKSHDSSLRDPIPDGVDLTLVQFREPTMRSLSNYELDLRYHKMAHSTAYLQYFLAIEAFYNVGFAEKWLRPNRSGTLLLRYETLLADPRDCLAQLFARLELDVSAAELTCGAEQIRISSADRTAFTTRKLETSKYYDPVLYREFASIVQHDADYLGYPPWAAADCASGGVSAIYRTLRAMQRKDFAGAVAAIQTIAGQPDLWLAVRQLHADALCGAGQNEAGYAVLEKLIADAPWFLDAYLSLAGFERSRGNDEAAREAIRAGVARTGNLVRAREFVTIDWPDAALLAEFAKPLDGVTRDDVIAAYRWLLGREPETEAAITGHLRCPDAAELRREFLRANEFREKYRQILGSTPVPRSLGGEPLPDSALREAFRWILGRDPGSAAVMPSAQSDDELRNILLNSTEFQQQFTL